MNIVEPVVAVSAAAQRGETVIEIRNLAVEYGVGKGCVRAVDGIDLTIRSGEVVGLAGESGCWQEHGCERDPADPAPAGPDRRR